MRRCDGVADMAGGAGQLRRGRFDLTRLLAMEILGPRSTRMRMHSNFESRRLTSFCNYCVGLITDCKFCSGQRSYGNSYFFLILCIAILDGGGGKIKTPVDDYCIVFVEASAVVDNNIGKHRRRSFPVPFVRVKSVQRTRGFSCFTLS